MTGLENWHRSLMVKQLSLHIQVSYINPPLPPPPPPPPPHTHLLCDLREFGLQSSLGLLLVLQLLVETLHFISKLLLLVAGADLGTVLVSEALLSLREAYDMYMYMYMLLYIQECV